MNDEASRRPNIVQFPCLDPNRPANAILVHGLDQDQRDALRKHCLDARKNAYCPYSSFRVGATFLTASHHLISGANIENAAYPSGTCAERVALGTAVASGGMKRGDFLALGIASDVLGRDGDTDGHNEVGRSNGEGEAKSEGFCSPCGMCRQALREFCELSMPIFMHDREGKYVVKTLGELLPMSFGPESLPPPEAMREHQNQHQHQQNQH